MNYFWPETNLGVTALVSCPCQEYLGTFAGNVGRLCNGTFTEGARWSPTIDDSACETKRSDISRQLCDLAAVRNRYNCYIPLVSAHRRILGMALVVCISQIMCV